MSTPIQPLPSDVINLIAAGEVIDSLAAGVRELVENAIDAGATRVNVSVYPQQWTLRVVDNGAGMTLDNLQQAAAAHSTSKIQNSQDLLCINSLGFRGEALHSLAQLGNLCICSRTPNTDAGWQLTYSHQGEALSTTTVAIAPGTIITVKDIFDTWPARRNVLPHRSQQLRQIQLTLYHLALCHPHITWQVDQHDRDWFSIYPGKTAKSILPQLVHTVQPSDLCEAKIQNPKSKIDLVFGLPDRCHRYRPDWIKVAINGRVVRSPELEQTIMGAFRRTLPRNRHPICFVHLHVPPHTIDWNRHPAKLDIYLDQMEDWRKQVAEAIASTLAQHLTTSDSFYSERVGKLLKTAESLGDYGFEDSGEQGSGGTEEPQSKIQNPKSKIQSSSVSLLKLKAIAQVHSMYIMAEHPSGMWLIEQHIAHERVLYEQLCDEWQVVPLDTPIIMSQLTPAQVEQLQRLTLTVDPFGDDIWAIRSLPKALVGREDCSDALTELSQGGNIDEAIVATACRTAIRNGTPMTQPEMQQLLDDWQRTRHPHTCPHGRPIYLVLEETRLSRFFRRHWVIGKSHGI
ncbi:MAG: DNA mismatch repair endonuclease MutL [Cyanobacteria bacterium P01_F01_bin.150]